MQPADAQRRVLRFLTGGDAQLTQAAAKGQFVLDGGDRGALGVGSRALQALAARGLIEIRGDRVACTPAARATRRVGSGDAITARPQERVVGAVAGESGIEPVVVNAAESPLALLCRRRNRQGDRFLEQREFTAGERLRRDFTRGQMTPRLGINWSAAGASGVQGGFAGRDAGITDSALAARQRVESALRTVGPELSGLLVDVCCFLKGLEQVEHERNWPARSAKVVLKTALQALARHYEPDQSGWKAACPPIVHWGTADYRPRIR